MQSLKRSLQVRWFGLLLLLLAISMLSPNITSTQANETRSDESRDRMDQGEQAINEYLALQDLTLKKDTDEYKSFLYSVLNDHYPELTKGKHADAVTYYIIQTLGLEADTTTPTVSDKSPEPQPNPMLAVSYNRWAARNYTYEWTSWTGGTRRNPSYAAFTADCTNFMSQALHAGGIAKAGSGSGGAENNANEWYMSKPNNQWAWSHSWSVVSNLRYYLRDKLGAYVEAYPANNEAVSLLISRAIEGDIIQFDVRDCDTCAWVPTHAVMVSTKKNNGGYYKNDLTYNDHSGGPNLVDSRDASLRAKLAAWSGVTNRRRMVWIKMW